VDGSTVATATHSSPAIAPGTAIKAAPSSSTAALFSAGKGLPSSQITVGPTSPHPLWGDDSILAARHRAKLALDFVKPERTVDVAAIFGAAGGGDGDGEGAYIARYEADLVSDLQAGKFEEGEEGDGPLDEGGEPLMSARGGHGHGGQGQGQGQGGVHFLSSRQQSYSKHEGSFRMSSGGNGGGSGGGSGGSSSSNIVGSGGGSGGGGAMAHTPQGLLLAAQLSAFAGGPVTARRDSAAALTFRAALAANMEASTRLGSDRLYTARSQKVTTRGHPPPSTSSSTSVPAPDAPDAGAVSAGEEGEGGEGGGLGYGEGDGDDHATINLFDGTNQPLLGHLGGFVPPVSPAPSMRGLGDAEALSSTRFFTPGDAIDEGETWG